MTGLIALDVFISLVFIFLLYSLLATSIVETITSFFGSRGKNLFTGIDRLLTDDENSSAANFSFLSLFFVKSKNQLTNIFFNHPSIKYLGKKGVVNSIPSYIKPKSFGTVLVDLLKNGDHEEEAGNIRTALGEEEKFDIAELDEDIQDLDEELKELELKKEDNSDEIADCLLQKANLLAKKEAIIKKRAQNPQEDFTIDKETRYQLKMLWQEAGDDIEKFKLLISEWYEDQMDRIVGWYKRKVSFLTFLIGLALAFNFQVDTIQIAIDLSKSEEMREVFVHGAKQFMEANKDGLKDKSAEEKKALMDSVEADIEKYGAVFGGKKEADNKYWFFGYLITALAISVGAPFWFDMLNKLMKLRSALQPPAVAQADQGNAGPQNPKAVG